ncbi:hypothetical protein PTSG_08359 [Salpingoeca rosetta]|uniref:Uncharacterized protein n=1 Tax=Salpingoeca rosetta (strain ATCC 50818 / BSB-021) TaxID=946362 RepID=F2UJG6_SALR5|nr:uncharacterized protein PTSG_08359 [Salpingoeca rosetta]EGD77265.1 hypothetical protein PTSG_08359 [Salpingoeca rosetta]|eukprot:XP_004990609.1 hypothetical protein PTSG_08359 [Salpingoeca rosetta]
MMTNRQPQQQRQGGRRHERRRSTYELHPPVLVGPEEDEEEEGFDDEVEGKLEQRRQPPQQEPQQAPLHHHHDDQQRKSKEGKIKMKQAARTHRKEGAEREEEKVEEAEEEEELFDERRANLTFLILGGGFLFAMIALLGIGIMDVVYGESLLVHALASLLIASISASVVVTYALGGRAAFSHHWRWFQPLRGGVRFVSLQIFSWTLFALSLALPTLPLILALFFPSSTFRGVILAAGLFAFVSQVVMATSIITYHEPQEQHADGGGEGGDQGGQQGRGKDRSGEGQARKGSEQDTAQQDTQEDEHRTDQHDKTAAAERAAATKRKAKRWAGKAPADGGKHKKHHEGDDKRKQKQQQQQQEEQVQEQEQAQDQEEEEEDARSVASAPGSIGYFLQSPQGHRWWTSFIGAQVLLSLTGLAYTVLLDVYIKHDAEPMLVFACLCCLTAAIFLTYGVGGRWAYSRKQWSFFQPFIGGPIFIALQMLAWTFFGTAAFVFLLHILRALSVCIPAYTDDVSALPTITTAGLAAFLAQVINVASLFGRTLMEKDSPM